ncbi:MAG: hypothetical protein LBT99_01435 [Bifidobacteriaceae bacterium]|jgi:hypothetical protein|nr:hypothetical protein [Bifidobacteriaceae bacterium]
MKNIDKRVATPKIFEMLIFVIFSTFIFINICETKSVYAANISEYRYSDSGSYQDKRWLDGTLFTQTSNGEIYYSLAQKELTDPLFSVCHFIAGGTDECEDISSSIEPLVTSNSFFYTITSDTNNNIYISYINGSDTVIAVIKIDAFSLVVTKSWKYNTPSPVVLEGSYPQHAFVQGNVLYFAVMNYTAGTGPMSFLYIDLTDPNSQIQSMPYVNCASGAQTCDMFFRDFKVLENNKKQAVTVLFYSYDQTGATKAFISLISDKKVISSYTVDNLTEMNYLTNIFFDNNNNLVMIDMFNFIYYFDISKNNVITQVKQFQSPLVETNSADIDKYGNIYLSGITNIGSEQEVFYRLNSKGNFTKVKVDGKYLQFQLKQFPDGCVYATTTQADVVQPTDLLRACDSDSFDYVDTFGFVQMLQSNIFFVNHKDALVNQKASLSLPDVLIFSYNPFGTSSILNRWVRLVYNKVPTPSPIPTPNPVSYSDTGVNLAVVIWLFSILNGLGASLFIYRQRCQLNCK